MFKKERTLPTLQELGKLLRSFFQISHLRWVILALLLGYSYYPTFVWMVERWTARDSYYGHGFLIPLVSLYWIFKKRDVIFKTAPAPDRLGLIVFGFGAALQIFASFFRIYFLSAISFIFVLSGSVFFLFGRRIFRHVAFPIAFLLLMVPLPLLSIAQVTLKMKFFVSQIAVYLLQQIGLPAVREGSFIYTRHSFLLVGDPCSGLRSFLAFLCLGWVFAYEAKFVLWKRMVLVASGLPLAVLSNVLRVFLLALIGEIYGTGVIQGPLHDASGIFVFIFAFICLLLLRAQLEKSNVPLN